MPAPPLVNDYTGTDGVTIDTTNSAAGGDAFQSVGGGSVVTYSTTQSHSGPTSMRIVTAAASPSPNGGLWTGLGSITTDVYSRWYLYMPSLPADNNFYPLNFRTSADASSMIIRILADGSVSVRDSSNTGIASIAGPVATGQWTRYETRHATGAGTVDLRYYASADSTTVTDSASQVAVTFGTNVDRVRLGTNTATSADGFTAYFDDFAISTADWIGPSAVESALIDFDYSKFPKSKLQPPVPVRY